MKALTGNTYPVKDQIKALGGKWDGDKKAWMIPDGKFDQASKLVAGAPKSAASGKNFSPKKCVICGHIEKRDSRGYPDPDRILKSGECVSCYEERKMGY